MPEWMIAIGNFTKEATPALFAVALACGLALFLPDAQIARLGLSNAVNASRGFIGGLFLFSGSIILTRLAFSIGSLVRRRLTWRINRRRLERVLHELTPDEKAYLLPYIRDGQTSVQFLEEDGIKGSLYAKRIIYRASNLGSLVEGWEYNLQPWARDYLKRKPELLEGHTDGLQPRRHWMRRI
jgi:hypothetical protein